MFLKRKRLRRSKFAEAMKEIKLDHVDVENSIVNLPEELKDTFRVAAIFCSLFFFCENQKVTFSSLKRGANWCEFGLNIQKDDLLKKSDVIFVTGLDFGMQRSLEGYHARNLGWVIFCLLFAIFW